MPTMPRELEMPEQFTLPYAEANFAAPRGREPLQNLGWADEEIQRNVGRRVMLATSKERQIERETGIALEVKFNSRTCFNSYLVSIFLDEHNAAFHLVT